MKTLWDIILGFWLINKCPWLVALAFLLPDNSKTSSDGCLFLAFGMGIFLLVFFIVIIVMAIPV